MAHPKRGPAIGDRLAESSRALRAEYNAALSKVFDDWDIPTSPVIIRAKAPSSEPPKLPIVSWFPRKWRPYVLLGLLILALTGEEVRFGWLGKAFGF